MGTAATKASMLAILKFVRIIHRDSFLQASASVSHVWNPALGPL